MRIALAVDGSPGSVIARDLVASLHWPPGSGVTLVGAYDVPIDWGSGGLGWGAGVTKVDEALRRQADEQLAAMASPLADGGMRVERLVRAGAAAEVILATADERNADLIVLGSRGHGRISSMLLGSVSASVADRAHRPVLVARRPRISRLLVATDGSAPVSGIPEVLAGLGVFRGAPAVALSVAPVDSPAFQLLVAMYTLGDQPRARQEQELHELHLAYATAVAGDLRDLGIPSEAEVRSGDVAEEIIKAASECDSDVIVVGSRGLRGLDRWLLGSVARNVLLHSSTSVLVVRPKGPVPDESSASD